MAVPPPPARDGPVRPPDVERLEALEEIRQLVALRPRPRQRDLDALSGSSRGVRVGRDARGRDALKAWFNATLREQFSGTAHVTGTT